MHCQGRAVTNGLSTAPVVPELRTRLGGRGYERIRPRTIDWWADEFEAMVQCISVGGDRR
jgi:hypothetical protein